MVHPKEIEQALVKVKDQESFLRLLSYTLHWPIDGKNVEDVSYEWSAKDLRAADLKDKIVDSRIFQIANLSSTQPWGIFVIEFKHPDAFLAEQGMTGTLRKVLRGLVPSLRKDVGQPSWKREHLLFVCTHKYQHFRIAYFKAPREGSKTAPLAAFGWGPDIPARTACEFNLPALEWPDNPKDAAAWVLGWAEAFNVEKVTKRFYTDYAREFEKLRAAVKELTGEDQKMFTQALMNRLMFLRFIERKKWLGYPAEAEPGDYLRLLFEAGGYRGKSFYTGRLRKLFFGALAVEDKQESEAVGKVPFLNGGLFEESERDKKVSDIPDLAFAPLLGPDGLLYRYNFTVQESTPLDIEVAVDPEMLGKVFEELVTGRHESGSYYTPRPVVSFMCREALKGYLGAATQLDASLIAAFVDKHDVSGINMFGAKRVSEALDDVRAVDPACGSGAYLLGLLHEIVDLYRILYSDKLKDDKRNNHRIKLDIIQNCLYGVDKDEFATNIAMLRLWLSLTVDSEEPQALPNLDFKIETGDSLTGPNPQEFSASLHLHNRALELAVMKGKYMRAHGPDKQSLRRLIQREQRDIALELHSMSPGAIDWRVQFCEIFFSDRGGFDIALANPPYVRQELIKDQKPALKKVYKKLYSGTADLYTFFYFRALQLLAKDGMLVFISSNKWFRAAYGQALREHVANTCCVISISDFKDLPVFENAIAYAMIFVARKGLGDCRTTFTEPMSLDAPYPDIQAVIAKEGKTLPTGALKSPIWIFAAEGTVSVFETIKSLGVSLSQNVHSRVYRGITTGLNEAFIVDDEIRGALIRADKKSAELIMPFSQGRDVQRWILEKNAKWIIFTRRGVDLSRYPAIKEHLLSWKRQLTPRSESDAIGRKPGRYKWYEIQDDIAYFEEFDKPKIISTKVSIRPTFALDVERRYLGNTAYFVPVSQANGRYLLGLLNSIVFFAYAKEVFVEKQNGWYEVQPKGLEAFPVVNAPTAERHALERLVDRCIEAKGRNCESAEQEIDERVAMLYQLTKQQLQLLRKRLSTQIENTDEKIKSSPEYQEYLKKQFG